MALSNILETIIKIPRRVLMALIRWYQVNFSPNHSEKGKKRYPLGYCKYTPSCSEYGYQAVERHGVLLGGLKACWRVIRCNPCSKGGYDPLK